MADLAADPILRAKAGDPAAFGELVDPLAGRLLLFLQRRAQGVTGGDCDAEDLLQATLARAWAALPGYEPRGPGSFFAWLRAIADGVVSDRRRYLEAKGRGAVGHLESRAGAAAYDPRTSVSKVAARREAFARATEVLRTLDPTSQRVVEAHLLEGLSLSEVAGAVGLSKAAVWERLHRAMAVLRAAAGPA